MAFDREHYKISFGGRLANNEEIWSCGLSLITYKGNSTDNVLWTEFESKMAAVVTEVEDYISHQNTFVPKGVKLEWVKAARIGTDGKYVSEPYILPASAEGYYADNYVPQATFVNTLVSNQWRNPGKYNRFYLPGFLPGGGGIYKLSPTDNQAYVTALKSFIEGLNSAVSGLPNLSSLYVGVVSNVGSGQSNEVIEVRVGNIIDTQRRRRNALVEDYKTADIVIL